MRSSEKKTILITILIGIVIIGGLLMLRSRGDKEENISKQEQNQLEESYVQVQADGSKLNISGELKKTKKLDGLEITNIQLKEIGGITTLLADVENKSGRETERKKVKVEVLNKNGEVLTTLKGIIDEMPVGGRVQLNMAVTADVANAYDFRISNL